MWTDRRVFMKNIFIIIALIFSQYVFSDVFSNPRVEGIIVSYDKNTVTLSQRGKKIKVPKKSIPGFFKIRSGNKVYAIIDRKKFKKKPRRAIDQNQKERSKKGESKQKPIKKI